MIALRRAHARPREIRPDVLVAVYVAAVVSAEALIVFVNVTAGVLVHAALVLLLIGRHLLHESSIPLPFLAIPSLLRLLSLTMPIPELPELAWYVLVGLPVLIASLLAVRAADLRMSDVGLRLQVHRADLIAAAMGLPLGLLASWAYAAPAAIGATSPMEVLVGSAILVVLVALPEELVFRGMIQRVFVEQFGGAGVALCAVLFAAIYLPSLSPALVAVMAAAGLVFGWAARSSGSLTGAVAGHAILVTSAWTLWPPVAS